MRRFPAKYRFALRPGLPRGQVALRATLALMAGAIFSFGCAHASRAATGPNAPDVPPGSQRSYIVKAYSLMDQKNQRGLRQLNAASLPSDEAATVYLEGYHVPTDGGDATFDWDPTSTTPDDNWSVIQPYAVLPNQPGRLIRRIDFNNLRFEQFGAKGDGVTDDAPAIQRAINTMVASYAKNIPGVTFRLMPGRRYLLNSSAVHLGQHIKIQGPTKVGNWPDSGGGYAVSQFFAGAGFLVNPAIASDGGVILQDVAAALQDLWIYNKNLVDNATSEQVRAAIGQWQADNSVGVLLASNGGYLDDVEVVGFTTGIKAQHVGRFKITDAAIDSVNGIDISGAGDTAYISRAHLVPWYGIHLRGDDDAWYRPGVGIRIHDRADGFTVDDALVLGWQTAYELSNVWAVSLTGVKADGSIYAAKRYATTGVMTKGYCAYCQINNPIFAGINVDFSFGHSDRDNYRSNVVVIGGSLAAAGEGTAAVTFRLGTASQVGIFNVQVNAEKLPIFDVGPNIRGAVVDNLMIMQGTPTKWKKVHPSSVAAFKFSNVWNMDVSPPALLQ